MIAVRGWDASPGQQFEQLLSDCRRAASSPASFIGSVTSADVIEIEVRPRVGSQANCSGCAQPAPGYDQLLLRRFEFIPVWGFAVELLYRMRRVRCGACGVKVEQVSWAAGKHDLTRAYMLHLAYWARKLS